MDEKTKEELTQELTQKTPSADAAADTSLPLPPVETTADNAGTAPAVPPTGTEQPLQPSPSVKESTEAPLSSPDTPTETIPPEDPTRGQSGAQMPDTNPYARFHREPAFIPPAPITVQRQKTGKTRFVLWMASVILMAAAAILTVLVLNRSISSEKAEEKDNKIPYNGNAASSYATEISLPEAPENRQQTLRLLRSLAGRVRVYVFRSHPTEEAVRLAWETVRRQAEKA